MKLKNNSLKIKVWQYLAIFSIIIIAFLWIFQILFLDTFYEHSKIKELNKTVKEAKNAFKSEEFYSIIEHYSDQTGICIQVISDNYVTYDSSMYNRSCNLQDVSYKQLFISSLMTEETYKLTNQKFKNDVLVKAVKLDENTFIFLSSSMQPMDNTAKILSDQLKILSLIVLIVAFIIGYFISKKISNPILKINNAAQKMASGDYENIFFYIEEDIDELNQLVKTMNNTVKELNKTEELQRELLANVGHDLRTPLTMIKAYAEMVRDLTYKDKTKREDNLNVIIEESDRLNLLVNDIVLLSTLKSNTIELDKEKFDIVNLANQIINRFSITDTNFILESDKEIIVKADIKRIEQVLYNLITNAINYTGDDKLVKIKIENIDKKHKISVTDTGKGIEEDELELIWKKYYKVDKKYKRDKKGSGIGLSIVEEILKKHKFKYGVDSKVNEGTTFWFII